MSKELEALKKFLDDYLTLCEKLHTNRQEKMLLDKNSSYNVLKTYLESIDNVEPSEALYELNRIDCNITYLLSDCDINEEVRICLNSIREYKSCKIIKQALLKAQEPKHYLKWEDLEFKKKQQVMDVLLNGKPYVLYFYKLSTQSEVNMFSVDMHIVTLNSYYPEDVQFFNDLHLERVEE